MILAIAATAVGLTILAWSADRFILGASAVARYLGMAPLLVGMVVIGFGTSAPEMVVSALAAADGSPDLALGNALGSNIANIGLVLGATALLLPVAVHRGVVRTELPALLLVTALAWVLLIDGQLSRADAVIMLVALLALMVAAVINGKRHADDQLAREVEAEAATYGLSRRAAWTWLIVGLVVLVLSSRLLVWGAVGIAERLGWAELVIGLTVVAIGTSAPELASAIAAARKGENDLVVGNVIGSNIFNTLAVIGIAGIIAPTAVSDDVITRDLLVVAVMSVLMVVFAWGRLGRGRINRLEGGVLVASFLSYTAYVLLTAV